MYALLHWYDREPRVVLKDTLAWDPAIDVILRPDPGVSFISPNPGAGRGPRDARSRALASGLDANDAFVIFPEGGNFTPARRERGDRAAAQARAGPDGRPGRADDQRARAPRPGGFLAALDAAPEADVVLVAHTGLDHMLTVADVWRELPMDKELVMRWWEVPARGDPGRSRRAHRLALRLVGADRRLDRRQPAGRLSPDAGVVRDDRTP